MRQDVKILKILMQNINESNVENLCNFLFSTLYSDDLYCLKNILLGEKHIQYITGQKIYIRLDVWQVKNIKDLDFCLNHGFAKKIKNDIYLSATVARDCDYKANVYVLYNTCDIDGNPIIAEDNSSVKREDILHEI